MSFTASLAVLLAATAVAPPLATPRTSTTPLVVRQYRTCHDARLAIGIPLEAPEGTLSDIVRIEVLSSLRLGAPLGLIYSLHNGREFFALSNGVASDPAVSEAADEFVAHGTLNPPLGGLDRSIEGFGITPVVVADPRRLASLGFERDNCAAIRVL